VNKYNVRLELNISSTDAVDVKVEADSIEEAKVKAIRRYETTGGEPYSIGSYGSKVSDNKSEWVVEECI